MSKSARCAVLLLTLLLSVSADALAQYRYDTWTTDNGLPQNGVRQISARNLPGAGCVFTLDLPRCAIPAHAVA